MRDVWQRMCILLVLCVGSLAFIATSPPPLLTIKKALNPIKIHLTKERPVRQFAIFVKDHPSEDSRPFSAEYGFAFDMFPRTAKDSDGKAIPVVTFAIAKGKADGGASACFSTTAACEWTERHQGVAASNNIQNSSIPREFEGFHFVEAIHFGLSGKWLYIKFTLGDVKEAFLTWQYVLAHSYMVEGEDQRIPQEPLVSISTQEIPVD